VADDSYALDKNSRIALSLVCFWGNDTMKSRGNASLVGVSVALLVLLASCHTVAVHRPPRRGPGVGYGPPPHAQAHGQRRKHVHGYELVYDAGCGVYVVVGMTDCYYHDGYFYRLRADVWEISLRADMWEPAGHDRVPPGLRIKTKSVAKLNGNGNSPVKLNGKGNSPVKLNGNAGGKGKLMAKNKK